MYRYNLTINRLFYILEFVLHICVECALCVYSHINIYCFQDLVALTKIYTSQLSNLMPVMIGREYLFELHWFYCVLVVPIQKVRTHFNISS